VVVTVPRRGRAVNGRNCVRIYTSEALDGLPEHGCRAWFVEPWHTGVFEKRLGCGAEGIAGQKHDMLTEVHAVVLHVFWKWALTV
jgi:hypothetical protein